MARNRGVVNLRQDLLPSILRAAGETGQPISKSIFDRDAVGRCICALACEERLAVGGAFLGAGQGEGREGLVRDEDCQSRCAALSSSDELPEDHCFQMIQWLLEALYADTRQSLREHRRGTDVKGVSLSLTCRRNDQEVHDLTLLFFLNPKRGGQHFRVVWTAQTEETGATTRPQLYTKDAPLMLQLLTTRKWYLTMALLDGAGEEMTHWPEQWGEEGLPVRIGKSAILTPNHVTHGSAAGALWSCQPGFFHVVGVKVKLHLQPHYRPAATLDPRVDGGSRPLKRRRVGSPRRP
jgi:hypothetical protein